MSTTVTGNINDLTGTAVTSNCYVRFWLRGCNGNQPRVGGSALIAPDNGPTYFQDFVPNASGQISGTLYSNDVNVSAGGQVGVTWYGVQVFLNGIPGAETPYSLTDGVSFNLNSATPITTNPVVAAPTGDSTYLRKDGGNMPAASLAVTGLSALNGNATVGGTLGVTGATTLSGLLTATKVKNLSAIRFVDTANSQGWSGADPGAWINAALADLPSTGGVVEIAAGTYACTTAITINKPCILRGQGTIGTTTSTYSSFLATTDLQNKTTASDLITITIPAGNFLSGVVLKDFGIEGNQFVGGASAGSNIRILGGSAATSLREILVDNIVCLNAFQAGVRISNNAFLLRLNNVTCVNNNGDGIAIDATTGNPSQIWLVNCSCDLNTGAGLHVSSSGGGNGGDVYIFGGTFSDSLHGIQFDVGSSSTIHAFGAHFEHNTNDGCHIFGSSGHYFSGCFFFGNTTTDFNLSSVGQGFTSCFANIHGSSFNSAPATANINIAASCNSTILGTQNGIGGGTGYTVIDAGFETIRMDKAIHKFFASSYSMNGLLPTVFLKDTTPAQATPNKSLTSKSGQLQFNNSAGTQVMAMDDTGDLWPSVVNSSDLGLNVLPWRKLFLGTAGTNNFVFTPAATAAARTVTIPDPLGNVNLPFVIASGTSTLTANATLAAVTSQAAITTAATGAATTDAIEWSYASAPGAGDSLCHVSPYVTSGNVNFVRTNPTAASQNVSAIVINWRVIR